MGLRFDNAQLLSAQSWGSVVGYAGIGVICSSSSSAINRSVLETRPWTPIVIILIF